MLGSFPLHLLGHLPEEFSSLDKKNDKGKYNFMIFLIIPLFAANLHNISVERGLYLEHKASNLQTVSFNSLGSQCC